MTAGMSKNSRTASRRPSSLATSPSCGSHEPRGSFAQQRSPGQPSPSDAAAALRGEVLAGADRVADAARSTRSRTAGRCRARSSRRPRTRTRRRTVRSRRRQHVMQLGGTAATTQRQPSAASSMTSPATSTQLPSRGTLHAVPTGHGPAARSTAALASFAEPARDHRRRIRRPADHDDLRIGLRRRGQAIGRQEEARLQAHVVEIGRQPFCCAVGRGARRRRRCPGSGSGTRSSDRKACRSSRRARCSRRSSAGCRRLW